MEYKEFINKLYIKNAWMTKEELTKQLFLNSVNDEHKITDKRNSPTTFKGYNSWISIESIAADVKEDLNQEGIKAFFENTFNSKPEKKTEYIDELCSKFKDAIPDISPDNICQKLTYFFITEVLGIDLHEVRRGDKSLNETDSEVDEKSVMSVHDIVLPNNTCFDSKNATSISSRFFYVSKFDREKIQELIIDISTTIDALFDLVKQIEEKEDMIGYNDALLEFGEMYKQRDDEYNSFITLYRKMHFYNIKYSFNIPEPQELNINLFSTKNQTIDIHFLNSALIELSSELDKCDSE